MPYTMSKITQFNKPTPLHRQTGFTLIEVLTVMVVLVAIASVTMQTTSNFAFEGRNEITKDRYEKIKKAIIGDPNQVVNGKPNINGFVADVGRLPFAIQELLDGNFCTDTRYFNSADCAAHGASWHETPNWQGPYISSTGSATNTNAISDGWGNTGLGNYGWTVTYLNNLSTLTTDIVSATNMTIQSIGKDQHSGSTTTDPYDADYPDFLTLPTIKYQDWLVNLNDLTINIYPPMGSYSCSGLPTDPTTCMIENGIWAEGSCTNKSSTTYSNCSLLGATWTGGRCSNNTSTTQSSCINTPGTWHPTGACSKSIYTAQVTCSTPSIWTPENCSDNISTTSSDCSLAGGTWTASTCSDNISTTQSACTTPGVWDASNCSDGVSIDKPTCTSTLGSWTIGTTNSTSCTGATPPESKLGCTSAGGIWSLGTCSDNVSTTYKACNSASGTWSPNSAVKLCLKLIRNYDNDNTKSTFISQNATITLDGREHLIQFPSTTNLAPQGKAIGMLYQDNDTDDDCRTNPPTNTYPTTNVESVCTATPGPLTPSACSSTGGKYMLDNQYEYCDGITTASCFNLGGTPQSKFQITFTPHTTLPTINW